MVITAALAAYSHFFPLTPYVLKHLHPLSIKIILVSFSGLSHKFALFDGYPHMIVPSEHTEMHITTEY